MTTMIGFILMSLTGFIVGLTIGGREFWIAMFVLFCAYAAGWLIAQPL